MYKRYQTDYRIDFRAPAPNIRPRGLFLKVKGLEEAQEISEKEISWDMGGFKLLEGDQQEEWVALLREQNVFLPLINMIWQMEERKMAGWWATAVEYATAKADLTRIRRHGGEEPMRDQEVDTWWHTTRKKELEKITELKQIKKYLVAIDKPAIHWFLTRGPIGLRPMIMGLVGRNELEKRQSTGGTSLI